MVASVVEAQTLTSSPYSRYGPGELVFPGLARHAALGECGQALRSSHYVNPINPASYSALRYTSFEAGLLANTGTYKNQTTTQTFNTGSLSYITYAFPFSSKQSFGGAIGLQPFSAIEYSFKDSNLSGPAPFKQFTVGSGGLSRLYVGVGKDFFKHLSLGLQGSYIFGSQASNINLLMPLDSSLLGVKTSRNTQLRGFLIEPGVQCHFSFYDSLFKNQTFRGIREYQLTLGATLQMNGTLQGTETYYAYRSNGSYIDTLRSNNEKSGQVSIPQGWQVGGSFQQPDHWMITADYAVRNWGSYKSFNNFDKLHNDRKIAVGLMWVPDINAGTAFVKKEGRTIKNYLKLVEYRAGYKNYASYILVNNNQLMEQSYHVGAGFPIQRASRGEIAKLNFSAAYVNRGTISNGMVQEQFFRFLVGVTFSDTWFIKRKIY
jgi:hypothetical protein